MANKRVLPDVAMGAVAAEPTAAVPVVDAVKSFYDKIKELPLDKKTPQGFNVYTVFGTGYTEIVDEWSSLDYVNYTPRPDENGIVSAEERTKQQMGAMHDGMLALPPYMYKVAHKVVEYTDTSRVTEIRILTKILWDVVESMAKYDPTCHGMLLHKKEFGE